MKLNHTQRLQVAREVRRQLPWAHIVVGAPGYNFIAVSRGEVIRGAYSTGAKQGFCGAAWSRPWPHSWVLDVDFSEMSAEYRRHMKPMPNETERMIVCDRWAVPQGHGRQTAADRIKMLADWIVTRAVNMPEAPRENGLLRRHERFEVKVNELDPLPLRVGGAK